MVVFASTRNRRPTYSLFPWTDRVTCSLFFFLYLLMGSILLDIDAPNRISDLNEKAFQQQIIPKTGSNSRNGPKDTSNNGLARMVSAPKSVDKKDTEPIVKALLEEHSKQSMKTITTIGYVVTVTDCGLFPVTEGAAVLQHSIARTGGRYDHQMMVIYHPDAKQCAMKLEDLGYTLVVRDPFVKVEEIQGALLRERIATNGCCGEKELLKFEAFSLTQFDIVVLLDLDTLLLKPLDALFDFMLHGTVPPSDHLQWPDQTIPDDISVLYTLDYAMVNPRRKIKPVQGGFLVLRPDIKVYEEFRSILQRGDYRERGGWGGVTGIFWGGMTFQGLIPYYYLLLHPGRSVELNRCIYNNMCSKVRDGTLVNGTVHGPCFTQEEDCEDCRERPLEEIVMAHFTVCRKPWTCQLHARDSIDHRLCRKLHHAWFAIRSDMEKSWGRSGYGSGKWRHHKHFYGYCTSFGQKGYESIQIPNRTLVA